jgi:hypothetical protein
MQVIYVVLGIVIVAVCAIFLTPVVGIIAFLVLAFGFVGLFGLAGGRASAGRLRTRPPEPTGRPRASSGGAETANQRQGQE